MTTNNRTSFTGPFASTNLRQDSIDVTDSIEQTPMPDEQPLYMSKAHEMKVTFTTQLKQRSLSTAHTKKAGLGNLPFMPGAGARKRMPEHDPENHEIMRMRTQDHLGWADIAEALNEERVANGKVYCFQFPLTSTQHYFITD